MYMKNKIKKLSIVLFIMSIIFIPLQIIISSEKSRKMKKVNFINRVINKDEEKIVKEIYATSNIVAKSLVGGGSIVAGISVAPLLNATFLVRKPIPCIKKEIESKFGEYINFEDRVFETLISRKTNKVIINKFLDIMEMLSEDKIIFKEKPILVNNSVKILEIQMLKDWRIYVMKDGGKYLICDLGHKNKQIRDIRRLKSFYVQRAS